MQVPVDAELSAPVQEAPQMVDDQAMPSVVGQLVVGPNTYGTFMKQSANRITKCIPDENLNFRRELEAGTMLE